MPDRDYGFREQEIPTRSCLISTKFPYCCCTCLSPLIPIFLDSFRIIFLDNPKLFLTIYTFTTLPLSFLLASLSLSSLSLKSHIARLEWLANVVVIRVESDHVRAEARADLHALYRFKALHGVPIFIFSLLALISAVSATLASRRRERPALGRIIAEVRTVWARPALTSVIAFAATAGWSLSSHATAATVGSYPTAAMAVTVVGAAAEVYIMAAVSLAMVVSVAEGRAGVVAVRAGLGLMRGRRVCGWVLSGLILAFSGCMGKGMVAVMGGVDLIRYSGVHDWTVEMRVGCMVGLVVLLGFVVLWSYVVITLFYWECRKRHASSVSGDHEQLDADDEVLI